MKFSRLLKTKLCEFLFIFTLCTTEAVAPTSVIDDGFLVVTL